MIDINYDTPISDIFLSNYEKGDRIPVRLVNALNRQNIYTMRDLIDICKDDKTSLLHIRHFGKKCMKHLDDKFCDMLNEPDVYNLEAGMDDDIFEVIQCAFFDPVKYSKPEKPNAEKVAKYMEKWYGPFTPEAKVALAEALKGTADFDFSIHYPAIYRMLCDISDYFAESGEMSH